MRSIIMAIAGVAVALLLGAGIVVFFGADFALDANRKEVKEASATAIHAISFNQRINEYLGAPVQIGEISVQREESKLLGPKTMTLSIIVTGTKGNGKATVNLFRAARSEPWVVKGGNFFPSSGPPMSIR